MIGDSIKKLRERLGLTQEQIAADPNFGINASTLASYERNIREPKVDKIIKMAKYFGVTTDYLIGVSAYETPENMVAGRELPVSNTSLEFLRSCPPDLLEVVDKMLAAPSVVNFLAALRSYVETSFISPNEIPDSVMPLLDHLSRKLKDDEFVALIDRWKWDEVCRELEEVYREIRDKFVPGSDQTKRGRPKKRGPYKKRASPIEFEGETEDQTSEELGGNDNGNG